MHNVFTYGSLMFGDVWEKVVSGKYKQEQGVLSGYIRKSVKHEEYPALIKGSADSEVSGVVYKNVSSKDLLRLDNFEGEYYKREVAWVMLSNEQTISAIFYLLKPEYHHILSKKTWNPEYFERNGIANFINQYFGFRNINN